LPPGTKITSAAKAIYNPIPMATSRQSTARLLFEKSQAIPSKVANPKKPNAI